MPPRARASRRRIAEMSSVVRALLDDIAAAGGLKGRVHREALDLVDAFTRGAIVDADAMAKARGSVAKVVGNIGPGSAPLLVALSYVPIELVFRMVEDGEDLSKHVLEHAVHASTGGATRVEELHAKAIREAANVDDAILASPTHEMVVGGSAVDLDLPEIALAHLVARHASRTGKSAPADATYAALAAHGYSPSPSLLDFERAYGGLELFESGPEAPALVVGPCALVASPWRGTRTNADDRVPVAFAWDDVSYELDARGRGFTNGRPSAPSGRALLAQAILWRALATDPRSFVAYEGKRGEVFANELDLSRLDEATGEAERWWGSAIGMRLVVEIDYGNGYAGPMTYVLNTQ